MLSAASPLRLRAGCWLLMLALATSNHAAHAQVTASSAQRGVSSYGSLLPNAGGPYPVTRTAQQFAASTMSGVQPVTTMDDPDRLPTSASWIVQTDGGYPSYVDADVYYEGDPYPYSSSPQHGLTSDAWCWQMLPQGLIYRSYQAGVHEPRMGIVFLEADGNAYWDAALGGRVPLIRYGDTAVIRPQGWQLDFEGAALPRLTLDDMRDLESVDFRAGVPLTYGMGDWQFKFGYYHLSSHLGDEFAIRNDALDDRINYVRDSLVAGVSYYPIPVMRVYAEVGYALYALGGAEPWEFQFGTELSQPGPTGFRGTPFLAMNGHVREDHNFGGDFTAQAGWLWRDPVGRTLRLGGHYFNGKSSQYQFFNNSEEQIGVGMWYDF
jgi:hypothetical protein